MKRIKLRNPFIIVITPAKSFIEYILIDGNVGTIKFHTSTTLYHYTLSSCTKQLLMNLDDDLITAGTVYNAWIRPTEAFSKTVYVKAENESEEAE